MRREKLCRLGVNAATRRLADARPSESVVVIFKPELARERDVVAGNITHHRHNAVRVLIGAVDQINSISRADPVHDPIAVHDKRAAPSKLIALERV